MPDRVIAGRYRLVQRLGAGGMGEVWLASDEELGRQVAMKRSQHGDNGQIRREARIGAGLQHPHVIAVFDVVIGGRRTLAGDGVHAVTQPRRDPRNGRGPAT